MSQKTAKIFPQELEEFIDRRSAKAQERPRRIVVTRSPLTISCSPRCCHHGSFIEEMAEEIVGPIVALNHRS